ncbi:CoA-acylating methylmalonate-semialdehyde dehydrogenase [Corynebacterium sanguinis]|uniref:methylmalonate-semialdehyde dehydrogenase (CoA acylating) n=1 Tax=Corynebacterium sanguinis TaxID=2594913 RepID=A0A6C1TW52_9CORY|nr:MULTISPECIES: CoA-acylating methylmalonate-semialdehyde dehydrogenase [Corynebacterium]MBA4505401.1 CoA-acylating methylmalonate-semialdehyde dehydrogenase [Corynebacterium sanguinis]MCT1413641.1 CoA-acylating methylmalonate-semialdehyde dehydrogenase [Corynebacterium sanguinis]MCT1463558.1 CoA-acylating methylmalonate-semialdehyde dehydrogenase [Corynebacterium sanguinis]MCT1499845.1 CoA-acylating methylmalonate-semialdehyde dehydrogenase [Corynebacterium sanguinis]MCT1555718.1 CoA-acylati
MSTTIHHFIGGESSAGASGRTSPVLNPNTGQTQAEVVLASVDDVHAAIAVAQQAQPAWAALNPQRRVRVIMEWIRLIHANLDSLARTLSLEHGKTLADAKGDILRGVDVLEFCLGAPHQFKGEYSSQVGSGIDTFSLRQPLGVVAGITPFNFPAMIPLWKAGPALACGNAFVLKPSERDPSVPVRLAELFIEAGGPAGVFNVVHGDKQAVDALLDSDVIKAVGFVGSTPIAKYIYERCAATGKRAQCFGGAKNHAIVLPDADIDATADALVGAAYGSAGERCMALSVVVPVGEETADRLRDALVARIPSLTVGHSLDPEADYGPLVSADSLARVRRLIAEGEDQGAELVVDGRGIDTSSSSFDGDGLSGGFFAGPTLFDRVEASMSIYTEEIFGPVLCMVRADTLEEAIAYPNDNAYGNGVAIFTSHGGAARDFLTNVNVGMVGINVPIPVPIAYHTFGGWKASGFGDLNQHGPDSFRFYTKTKTVTTRWPDETSAGPEFTIPVMS